MLHFAGKMQAYGIESLDANAVEESHAAPLRAREADSELVA